MIDHLNREEILRYLGYKDSGVTERIGQLLDRCEAETLEILQPKYIYRRFSIEKRDEGICIPGTALVLSGRDIQEHLKNCDEMFLLGATAGIELDKRIRRYMVTAPDVGVVMDSCGIQAVEQIAGSGGKRDGAGGFGGGLSFDLAFQSGIRRSAAGNSKGISSSAGYPSEDWRVPDRKLSDDAEQIGDGHPGNQ